MVRDPVVLTKRGYVESVQYKMNTLITIDEVEESPPRRFMKPLSFKVYLHKGLFDEEEPSKTRSNIYHSQKIQLIIFNNYFENTVGNRRIVDTCVKTTSS